MTAKEDEAKAANASENKENVKKGKKKKPEVEADEMSEEDKKAKEELEALVATITNPTSPDAAVQTALQTVGDELRNAKSLMTSVPRPLKFLRPHFEKLEDSFTLLPTDSQNRKFLADVLSVLATTIAPAPPLSQTSPNESEVPPAESPPTADASEETSGGATAKSGQTTTDEATARADGKGDAAMAPTPRRRRRQLCLYYRLQGGVTELTSWGPEYLRNLSGEIAAEHQEMQGRSQEQSVKDGDVAMTDSTKSDKLKVGGDNEDAGGAGATLEQLHELVDIIVPFNMKGNSETDTIDLLAEVETVQKIEPFVDQANCQRVVNYLNAISAFAATDDEAAAILSVSFRILVNQNKLTEALRIAMKLNDTSKIHHVIQTCKDPLVLKQIAICCFRHRIVIEWAELCNAECLASEGQDAEALGLTTAEELTQLSGGEWLSQHFRKLAEELDVLEPKLPENVYKAHLEEKATVVVDSAKQNLAATFVNGFVNAGFCNDALLCPEDSTWLYKNRDHGMLSAAASLGLIYLWNMEEGPLKVDPLQYSQDPNVKAGSFVGMGITGGGVRSEYDPAYTLLADYVETGGAQERIGAILGLGIAYAGTHRADLQDSLIPVAIDMANSVELCATASLALGLIFVGSADEAVAEVLVQALMERGAAASLNPETQQTDGDDSTERIMICQICLALSLVYLGKRSASEGILLALEAVASPFKEYASITIEGFSYAGSGDVLQIQRMLQSCVELSKEPESTEEDEQQPAVPPASAPAGTTTQPTTADAVAPHIGGSASVTTGAPPAESKPGAPPAVPPSPMPQAAAVVNLAVIAMGESTGSTMVLRLFEHMLQHGSMPMRRAIPIALALHSASTPTPAIVDSLSKLSHDPDADVALHAVLALGIVGAGTNNSRIAGLLRRLAAYYSKDASALFTVRIAQGLLYMGKGLLTLNPMHSESFIFDPAAFGALLLVMHSCINLRKTILTRHHFLLFYLVPAMFPRFLMTLDENLKLLQVPVRVGQAVDLVGQAGQPKGVTGFQTHTTPVLLAAGERAELANEDYEPMTPILEGVVILKKKAEEAKPPAETGMQFSKTAALNARTVSALAEDMQ